MPTYVAFLRAINLGARRKFPREAIRAAVEATGATEVETYLNTGNVRLRTSLRSPSRVTRTLEQAFLADRDFEVPTVVLRPGELVQVAADADELWARHGEPLSHYVTLLQEPPALEAVERAHAAGVEGERVHVLGRAAHLMLHKQFHTSRLADSAVLKALGTGTARNVTVVRTLAERWGS